MSDHKDEDEAFTDLLNELGEEQQRKRKRHQHEERDED